jgi:hypothetical protein
MICLTPAFDRRAPRARSATVRQNPSPEGRGGFTLYGGANDYRLQTGKNRW